MPSPQCPVLVDGRFANGHSLISNGFSFLNKSTRDAGVNPFRVRAFEELAKHYEHREKNYGMALEMTRSALAIEDTPEIRRREQRLKTRIERPRTRRLAL